MTRYVDPHLDPLRAPTARGQHPHTLRSVDEVKNPQHMFEHRDGMGVYHGQPAAPPPRRPVAGPPPEQKTLLENPLVMLGLGAVLLYAVSQILKNKDEQPRKNPAPAQSTPAPVFVMPASIPVTTASSDSVPKLLSEPAPAPKIKKRRRRTTQARTASGTYLPAGTRKRAKVEGQEKT